jgi:hypothetical protein
MTRRPGPGRVVGGRRLTLTLSGFAWEAIKRESASMDVPIEDLINFAVMYYIADADSGRIARRISGQPYATTSP